VAKSMSETLALFLCLFSLKSIPIASNLLCISCDVSMAEPQQNSNAYDPACPGGEIYTPGNLGSSEC
jgi:hypothetical protein